MRTITALAPQRYDQFQETGDLDLAYTPDGLPRFRVNVFRQRGAISFALPRDPGDGARRFEELGPAARRRGASPRSTAASCSSPAPPAPARRPRSPRWSTTSTARVRSHIVTIEDPIEILHADHLSIVNQREVGLDTESFGQALRRALRQDPDTILIGELRDAETAQTALQAAESGHLVLSTMHTDRRRGDGRRGMVEFFPEAKQQQIRSIMAGVLRGVVSQRLLPRAGGGRVAAVEVMVTNARIADLIRENRADEITDAIADGELLQDADLRAGADRAGRSADEVDTETAANARQNRHDFLVALEREQKRRTVGGGRRSEPARR